MSAPEPSGAVRKLIRMIEMSGPRATGRLQGAVYSSALTAAMRTVDEVAASLTDDDWAGRDPLQQVRDRLERLQIEVRAGIDDAPSAAGSVESFAAR